jgi:hypothetical protein
MSTNDEDMIVPENTEPVQEVVQVPMVDYTVFDAEGRVVRRGKCPQTIIEHQAFNEGETVMEGEHTDMIEEEQAYSKHTVIRQRSYPSIGDQLDVLWKIVAAVPAFQIPEAVEMLERIQAAKDAAPKGKLFCLSTGAEIQPADKE